MYIKVNVYMRANIHKFIECQVTTFILRLCRVADIICPPALSSECYTFTLQLFQPYTYVLIARKCCRYSRYDEIKIKPNTSRQYKRET